MATRKKYDSDNIKNLQGMEAIRAKPGMYIGATDASGVFTILREAADNVVDEALAGRASVCEVHIDKSNLYWVIDDGEGIPVKPISVKDQFSNKVHRVPAITAILSLTHTSGKFEQSDASAYTASRGCFTGDTEIRLLDGTVKTFEQLHTEWKKDQTPIPVMSFDLKKERLSPSQISHVQITKYTDELVHVHLDDGSVVKCTPDHKFYVNRNGVTGPVRADRLQLDESLVSSYYSVYNKGKMAGYATMTEQGKKRMIHRIVGSSIYMKEKGKGIPKFHHVHHVSRNRSDNRPDNLEVITSADHQREHREERSELGYKKIMEEQADLRAENSAKLIEQNADEDFIEQAKSSRALSVAVRAVLKDGRLTKLGYNSARRNNDLSLKKAVECFGSFKDLKSASEQKANKISARIGRSMLAEDLVEDAVNGVGKTPQEQSAEKNWIKTQKVWREVLMAHPHPEDMTPREFNVRNGAAVFGRYAHLAKYTSLRKLKAHVLEGKELELHHDQSPEMQEERMIQAEIRMRDPENLKKIVQYFCTGLRKIRGEFTQEAYERAKPSCSPQWRFANAVLDHLYGGIEDLADFVRSYNHRVVKIVHKKLKKPVPVFDITVDKTHVFFVGTGCLVANSHGVGIKASNALSSYFKVCTFRDGAWWGLEYAKGVLQADLEKVKAPIHPVSGKPIKKGTVVLLRPDEKIFSDIRMSLVSLGDWGRIAAFFTPGLKVRLSRHDGVSREYFFENGPREYVDIQIKKLKTEPVSDAVFVCQNALIDCVASFTNLDGSSMDAFTNGLHNAEGGRHMDAFFQTFKSVLLEYAKGKSAPVKRAAGKRRQGRSAAGKTAAEFTLNDIKEGLVGLINVKLSAPHFDSQTKDKLVDERADLPVRELLKVELKKFFDANKKLATQLCDKAIRINSLRSKFIASKKVVSELKKISNKGLPAKAAVAPNCTPEERELFIVEGDSAAGPSRSARFAYFQEILPIRGKILNTGKNSENRAMESEEILGILAQIGLDPRAEDPLSKLRVQGKIICLADPDPDGPLVGSTSVPVFYGGEWLYLTMEQLAEPEWVDREFQVMSWNGRKFVLGDAHSCRITEYVSRIVRLTLANDQVLECSENHLWSVFKSTSDHREVITSTSYLPMMRAELFRPGDNILTPDPGGMTRAPTDLIDSRVLNATAVLKVETISVKPTPVYCLAVNGFHNFVLANGAISKNCHINALLLTLFWKFLPGLFDRGMIYCAQVPEYYAVSKDGQSFFADKAAQLQKKLAKAKVRAEIQHCKGYGEVDHELLRVMAFNPETRRIARIVPTVDKDGDVNFRLLTGGGTAARKRIMGL